MLALIRIEAFRAFLSLKNRQYILKIELNPTQFQNYWYFCRKINQRIGLTVEIIL